MFNSIVGIVTQQHEQRVVVQVGPVTIAVQVPNSGVYTIKDSAELHTYLHWNQENGPSLFGFETELDRTVFEIIIGCSGLGPKIGLAVLQKMSSGRFLQAIQADDSKALSSVNGIGAKKAEQIIVQLRHKVAQLLKSGVQLDNNSITQHWGNISEVLSSLNYSQSEIGAALKYVYDAHGSTPGLSFDVVMRHALSFLSQRK